MRHRRARYKLGMRTSHREAMLRNMVTSLFEHESITTTDARAKALRSLADKMITLGKRGDLHARRQVHNQVPERDKVCLRFIRGLRQDENRTRDGRRCSRLE